MTLMSNNMTHFALMMKQEKRSDASNYFTITIYYTHLPSPLISVTSFVIIPLNKNLIRADPEFQRVCYLDGKLFIVM